MDIKKVKVRNGRLALDEPTDLPEGTELELVAADDGDDLDADERALLHEQLKRSLDEARAGRTVPAEAVLARLRSKR